MYCTWHSATESNSLSALVVFWKSGLVLFSLCSFSHALSIWAPVRFKVQDLVCDLTNCLSTYLAQPRIIALIELVNQVVGRLSGVVIEIAAISSSIVQKRLAHLPACQLVNPRHTFYAFVDCCRQLCMLTDHSQRLLYIRRGQSLALISSIVCFYFLCEV